MLRSLCSLPAPGDRHLHVIDGLEGHATPPIPLIPAKAGTQAGAGAGASIARGDAVAVKSTEPTFAPATVTGRDAGDIVTEDFVGVTV